MPVPMTNTSNASLSSLIARDRYMYSRMASPDIQNPLTSHTAPLSRPQNFSIKFLLTVHIRALFPHTNIGTVVNKQTT